MKDKILLFIIGVLVGAVITTGAFYVYTRATTCSNNNPGMQMNGGNPPQMPNGQQPPEMPNNNTQDNAQNNNN